jgi:hypothetical protein
VELLVLVVMVVEEMVLGQAMVQMELLTRVAVAVAVRLVVVLAAMAVVV